MAKSKTRLELTWIGKENRPKLEPRILIEDSAKSYHAAHRVSENDVQMECWPTVGRRSLLDGSLAECLVTHSH